MDPTRQVETKILSVIRRKKNWYKYKNVLQSAFFSSEETRQIFQIVEGFFGKYTSPKLTTANMKLLINKNIRDNELKQNCLKVIRTIRRTHSTDGKVVEETIKDFARRQLVKMGITETLTLLDMPNPDFSTIKDHFERAINISTEDEKDIYKYFEDPQGRIKLEGTEKRVSTCIPKFDEILDGGLSPGELCVFLGPPGRGKTTVLINMGVAGLLQGLSVCHVTLEISDRKVARRYDMRISGKTFDTLRKFPDKISNPLSRLKKKGCELIIKDYGMESPKVGDIEGMIYNYQNRLKKKFDLLVVDYGDLIHPTHRYKESRFGMEEVYTELRRLARRLNIPCYTASQSTRKSMNKNVVDMEDVAEAFGKVKVADVVVGICQTQEEEEEKLCRFFMAKSRKRSGHPVIRLECDTDKMYIGEYRHGKDTTRKSRGLQKDW